jgi:drug/metabolite transporter (DMT)-like permease
MVWARFFLGVIACASSVIFIKSTTMNASLLAAMRLLFAIILLLPLFLHRLRLHPDIDRWEPWRRAWIPGILLGVHFITWNMGARLTLAAHATLIVNMVPVVLPIMLWLTHREAVSKLEWLATGASMLGIGWLALHDYHFSRDYLAGDLICLLSMGFFAAYLSMGRKNRDSRSIFLYIYPVYAVACIVCTLGALPKIGELPTLQLQDYLVALALAVIPTMIGHSAINETMRHLRGQVVGVVNVGQFVFSGIFAFFLFGEVPHTVFYWVSAFIVIACWLAILSHRKGEKPLPVKKVS